MMVVMKIHVKGCGDDDVYEAFKSESLHVKDCNDAQCCGNDVHLHGVGVGVGMIIL